MRRRAAGPARFEGDHFGGTVEDAHVGRQVSDWLIVVRNRGHVPAMLRRFRLLDRQGLRVRSVLVMSAGAYRTTAHISFAACASRVQDCHP